MSDRVATPEPGAPERYKYAERLLEQRVADISDELGRVYDAFGT